MPARKTTTTRKTASKATPKKKAAASPKSTKKTPAKKKTTRKSPAKAEAKDTEVTIDRRRAPRRDEQTGTAAAPKLERRAKVARRRQIDPTTCERDYSEQEVAFMSALDEYKRKNGRMFPTCSEVLEVIRSLGYVQLSPAELAQRQALQSDESGESDWTDNDHADAEVLEAELVG